MFFSAATARRLKKSKWFRGSDGRRIACVSKRDAAHLHGQIFGDELYAKHGIDYPRDGVYVDVGANIGMFLLYVSGRAPGLTYFGFEPIPEIHSALQANVESVEGGSVSVFNEGLSSEPGQASFNYLPRTPCCSHQLGTMAGEDHERAIDFTEKMIEHSTSGPVSVGFQRLPAPTRRWIAKRVNDWYGKKQLVTCRLTTLSRVIDEHGLAEIDLLKIDAEGAEVATLAGLRDEHWGRVRQVIVEVHDEGGTGRAYEQVAAALTGNGLRVTEEGNPQFEQTRLLFGVRL